VALVVSTAAFGLWPKAFPSECIRRDADCGDQDGRAPLSQTDGRMWRVGQRLNLSPAYGTDWIWLKFSAVPFPRCLRLWIFRH
jgi:hypothetical protein